MTAHFDDAYGVVLRVTAMDWIASPLATLLAGGIVGAGSALLLDYVKSRSDENRQWQDARREVYVAYLTELSKAYESLWALALGDGEALPET